MKTCTKCGETKHRSRFGTNKNRKGGLQCWCKTCNTKYNREYLAKNRDSIRNHKRIYYANNRASVLKRVHDYRVENREQIARHKQERHLAHPEHKKAQDAIKTEKRAGRLSVKPCEMCGSDENIDAHHDDYSKPLDVQWLCRGCHLRLHVKKKQEKQHERQL